MVTKSHQQGAMVVAVQEGDSVEVDLKWAFQAAAAVVAGEGVKLVMLRVQAGYKRTRQIKPHPMLLLLTCQGFHCLLQHLNVVCESLLL